MKKITSLLAAGFAAICIQSASAGLISLYQYDNNLSDTVRGAGGAASLVSGSSNYVTGKVGQAFDFNGSTFMRAPQAAGGLSAFSISAWVNFDNSTQWGTIVKNWGSTQIGAFHFGLTDNNFTLSNSIGSTGGENWVVSPSALATDTWYHTAVTFGPSLTQKLYINGTQVDSNAASGTIVNTLFPYMSMGGKLQDDQISSAGGWLDGYMDELAFFNQELTSSDITGIHNAGLAGNSITTLGYSVEPYGAAAVPEPGQVAASLLLLSGIGGYVFLKRRKAAKPALMPTAA